MSKAKTKSPSTTTISKTSNLTETLKFYRLNEKAQLPAFSTQQSACFDLHANLIDGEEVQYYQAISTKILPRRVAFDINTIFIIIKYI